MFKIMSGAARHLSVPIERPVRTAFGTMTERHLMLIVLEDDQGHLGVGETWVNFPVWAPWERLAACERVIASACSGSSETISSSRSSSSSAASTAGDSLASGVLAPAWRILFICRRPWSARTRVPVTRIAAPALRSERKET